MHSLIICFPIDFTNSFPIPPLIKYVVDFCSCSFFPFNFLVRFYSCHFFIHYVIHLFISLLLLFLIIIIIIINLIYIAQFDTNGILTALYIVITYIQMQYVHVCTYAEQSYKYTYTCLHIRTYTVTCTNIHLPTY